MNTALVSGARLARLIRLRANEEASLLGKQGLGPVLAIVVATDDHSTNWHVRSIKLDAEETGIDCQVVDLGHDATEQTLANVLRELGAEPSVSGIVLQAPLPRGVRAGVLVGLIPPEKDVNGANPLSLGRLVVGQQAFAHTTARAVVELLDHIQVPVAGRNVVIIGRSAALGMPLSLLLLAKDAAVTVCHSKAGALEPYVKAADVVVVAAGGSGMLTGSQVSPRSTVVDVGMNVPFDDSVAGHVYEASVIGLAALTPVATALMLLHTAVAAREQRGSLASVEPSADDNAGATRRKTAAQSISVQWPDRPRSAVHRLVVSDTAFAKVLHTTANADGLPQMV